VRVCWAILTLIGALAGPVPPARAATCAFDPSTASVTIEVGDGETGVIARSGDAITLNGAPCGSATVSTTDTIVVNGTGTPVEVEIDLSGGPFAPGATPEDGGGDTEIEFAINLPSGSPTVLISGSAGADAITVGAAGINLNATETTGDADVTIVGTPLIAVEGLAGTDVLSVAGGAGTGAPGAASLSGGDDDDELLGGLGGSTLDGGNGIDTGDYTSATGGVNANLATGVAGHGAGGTDQLAQIENLVGSRKADTLTGDAQANLLAGGHGADTISGHDAGDAIIGGDGRDRLFGQKGPDDLFGGPAKDQLDGGKAKDFCRGGPDPDSFVFCEAIQLN
jgi:Ca2+-binding RTX toxin-like protein